MLSSNQTEILNLSKKLDKFGYFDMINDSIKLVEFKRLMDSEFERSKWISLPNDYLISSKLGVERYSSNSSSSDFRSFEVYGSDMYEGNLLSYLKCASFVLNKHDLKLFVGSEDLQWGDKSEGYHYFKHEVILNGTNYLVFEGNISDRSLNSPQIYVENIIKILNTELEKQGSNQKFIILTSIECIYYVLVDDTLLKQFDSIKSQIHNELIVL